MTASKRQRIGLITGANSGLGLALSQQLAARGHRLYLLCRDALRGRRALEQVRQQSGNPEVYLLVADLSDREQVRAATESFLCREHCLDWLVNNAGVLMSRLAHNAAGVEMTLAVNHLGHFQLTQALLPALRRGGRGRILNITSVNHRYSRLGFDDLENHYSFQPVLAYNRAKLAQVLCTYALHQRLQGTGIAVNCVHPGALRTGIYRYQGRWLRWALNMISRPPGAAAAWLTALLNRDTEPPLSGAYLAGGKVKRSSAASYDPALMQQVWQLSCRLTGVPDLPVQHVRAGGAEPCGQATPLITKDVLP